MTYFVLFSAMGPYKIIKVWT